MYFLLSVTESYCGCELSSGESCRVKKGHQCRSRIYQKKKNSLQHFTKCWILCGSHSTHEKKPVSLPGYFFSTVIIKNCTSFEFQQNTLKIKVVYGLTEAGPPKFFPLVKRRPDTPFWRPVGSIYLPEKPLWIVKWPRSLPKELGGRLHFFALGRFWMCLHPRML